MIDKIKKLAKKYSEEFIEIRHHLHANPELSYQEFETSKFVQGKLKEFGIPFEIKATTGVVGLIKGKNPQKRIIAIRADMDALPIREENDVPYKSKNEGIMHACGHDVHTTCLLGAAKILSELKNEWEGTVKLIFQPGEEKLPGGASIMLKEGVLKPKPIAVIGQHVSPNIEQGKIGIRKGKFMASMDEIFVEVRGKGGHGAQPHQNIDPVVISANIIVAMQQIVSRMSDPAMPTVLSFGKVIADGAINVIPDKVYMEGTFRTLDEKWRSEAHIRMTKMAKSIAESMGGSCDFKIVRGYPFLINEEKLTEEVFGFAQEYLGKENVIEADQWMAAEDFASYSQQADACFFLLGIRNEKKGITSSLHTPTFNIDEDALQKSTGLMAHIALRKLGN